MALKPFTPKDTDITSSDAFKGAVEEHFGKRFNDLRTRGWKESEDWEELFRQYHDLLYPNNNVEVICVTNATDADLRFKVTSQKLAIPDTSDQNFHQFPKRKIKPKPID